MRANRIQRSATNRRKRRWFALGNPGAVTVLDLDGQMVRVAQAGRRGGKPAIIRFAAKKLTGAIGASDADPTALGKSIAAALADLKLKTGSVVMAVPRSLVFLRTLTLPAANSIGELASMVQFQISKDLPFRLEEAVVDFTVLRFLTSPAPSAIDAPVTGNGDSSQERGQPVRAKNDVNAAQPAANDTSETPDALKQAAAAAKVEVLTAVVKKDIVERYALIAAAAGLKLASLGLRACAHARCLGVRHSTNGQRAVALVSLRSDEVTIEFVVDQSVVFSRVASVPPASAGSNGTDNDAEQTQAPSAPAAPPRTGADFTQAVTTELVRSLHSYESLAGHCPAEKILVAGGTGQEPALVAALSHRFPMPCEIFVPSSALGVETPDQESGAGALAALGLALSAGDPEGLPFDFLNPKQPPVPRNWRRIKILASTGVGAILLFGLVGWRSYLIGRRAQIKEQVQTQVSQAEKNRPLFRDLRLKAKVVRDWSAEKRNWLDHYALLSSLLPPSQDVYLTSLATGARGVIHLSVQARSGEILAQMDKRLREAGYEVKPLAVTPGTDKFGYAFRSSVELTLPAKMKMDLKKTAAPARQADDGSLDPPAASKP